MKELLTRKECTAMRGIAILAIMLHNYTHWLKGIVRENEYTWQYAKWDQLWQVIQNPDELLPMHLFSFFGHYGVPVFLFLSGYGLVKNHAFVDGNKRIGAHAMLVFLAVNGIRIWYTQKELSDIIVQIASGEKDYPDLLLWLRSHTVD